MKAADNLKSDIPEQLLVNISPYHSTFIYPLK